MLCSLAIINSCSLELVPADNPTDDAISEETIYSYTFGIGGESNDTKSLITAANRYVEWDGTENLGVYAKKDEDISYNQSCDVAISPSVSFTLKSYYALESGDALYAYYPYNYVNTSTTEYRNPNNVHLEIKSAQAQDGDEFDSSAMPLVAKYVLTEDLEAATEKAVATLNFANLAGILDFKVYSSNATYQSEVVKSVTFTANSALCGGFQYNLSGLDLSTSSTLNISGYEGTSVTTTVTNASALTGEKATAYDVIMAVAPGSYTGKVEVVTDKAIYTYNIASAKTVGRSQILSLGVNLGTGSRKSIDPTDYNWALVKSAATVAVGEWIAIAASGYDVALSTTQNDNNRGEVAITKAGDALTAAATMQMFEVVAGASTGQYAFKAINGSTRGKYLCAASSSSNYLRSKDVIDENSSWTVSVTAAGVATVTAQGSFTRNLLQYNQTSTIFSAYGSAQKSVAIYILDDPTAVKLNPSTTSVNFLATDGSSDDVDVDFSIKNVSTWTVVNSNDTDFDVLDDITDATSAVVNIAPASTNNTYSPKSATITVSATGADDVVISVNQAAKVASLTVTPDKTIATKAEDIIEIEIEANVPWTISADLGTVEFVDGSYDPYDSEDYSAPATSSNTVYAIIPENATGANRDITITITPSEVGSGLSNEKIVINQLGTVATPLDEPENVAITNISIANKNYSGSWSAVANATNYDWMISTASTAPASTSDASVKAYGNATTTSFSADVATAPSAGTAYYLYVKANGTGSYTPSDYSQGHAILYQHVFASGDINTSSPQNGVTLSGISWNKTGSSIGGYNSSNYKGFQFGTSSAAGSLVFTSANSWGGQSSSAYEGYSTVKKIVVWLNAGGNGTATASVTIDGKSATSDGSTVSKNSTASSYADTTPITFTPAADGKTGVIVITATKATAKAAAGYFSAMEVLSE